MYQLENEEGTVVSDLSTGAVCIHPGVWLWAEYQQWLAEGNQPRPKKPGPHHNFDEATWTWIEDVEARKADARAIMSCGPLQIRQALRQLGLLKTIKDFMKKADEKTVEAWEYASVFHRLDPFVLTMQQAMGKTDDEVDQIFQLALTFK